MSNQERERAALLRALASVIHGATASGSSIDRAEYLREHVMCDGYNATDCLELWPAAEKEVLAHLAEFDAAK